MGMSLFITVLVLINPVYAIVYRPVVLMHGVTATAADMDELAGWLRTSFPNMYVVSIEIWQWV